MTELRESRTNFSRRKRRQLLAAATEADTPMVDVWERIERLERPSYGAPCFLDASLWDNAFLAFRNVSPRSAGG